MSVFRCVAYEETDAWRHQLPSGGRAFGIYVFKQGRASFRCSTATDDTVHLTAVTWCSFLRNEFIGVPDAFAQENADVGESQFTPYLPADSSCASQVRFLSEPIEAEDFEEAREYFCSAVPNIPILWEVAHSHPIVHSFH